MIKVLKQWTIQGRRTNNKKTFVIWGSVLVLAPWMGISCDLPTSTRPSFIQQSCISSLITSEPGGCAAFSCLVAALPLAVDGWWTRQRHAAPIDTRTHARTSTGKESNANVCKQLCGQNVSAAGGFNRGSEWWQWRCVASTWFWSKASF